MKKQKQTMDTLEKILLLETLMHDIRSWWDGGKLKRYQDKRVWECLKLVDELSIIANDYKHKDHNKVYGIYWFNFYQSIGVYLAGRHEGRYLRMSICNGGYEGLKAFHRLKPNFSMRSKEFCQITKKLCCADYTFFNK